MQSAPCAGSHDRDAMAGISVALSLIVEKPDAMRAAEITIPMEEATGR